MRGSLIWDLLFIKNKGGCPNFAICWFSVVFFWQFTINYQGIKSTVYSASEDGWTTLQTLCIPKVKMCFNAARFTFEPIDEMRWFFCYHVQVIISYAWMISPSWKYRRLPPMNWIFNSLKVIVSTILKCLSSVALPIWMSSYGSCSTETNIEDPDVYTLSAFREAPYIIRLFLEQVAD